MVDRRRSVRNFTSEAIGKEEISRMLKTALEAPSSRNSRSSSFMVVEERSLLERMAGMRDYGSAFLDKAPLVILVMGDAERSDLWSVNASISATYLQLAAEALGLGSCWVHVDGRPYRREEPDGLSAEEYLRSFLPVPQGRHILCAVAIGHPTEAPKPRRETNDMAERVIEAK